MELLDGKKVSSFLKEKIKEEVDKMVEEGQRVPHLSAILVGDDPASATYVRNKTRACNYVGFKSSVFKFDNDITEAQIIKKVEEINNNNQIDGLIVQLPLPAHISENKVINAISYQKDVDGFHPVNIGKMVKNIDTILPATPSGILELLKYYNLEISGKNCVIVGRSNIVGMPMSILMGRKNNPGNATVTMVHSRTKNIAEICKNADILIVAIGKPKFITENMVKKGAVVIDVGINQIKDNSVNKGYRLVGDVDFEDVKNKCSYITPVPGGVGPMTIAALMLNTIKTYKITNS